MYRKIFAAITVLLRSLKKHLQETENRISHLVLILTCLTIVSTVTAVGYVSISKVIRSTGTVKTINVEVFWDSGCTQVVDLIDWGDLEPGESADKTVYVKNTGNAALTLNMYYSGWDPPGAGEYITLSWDKEGVTLNSGEVVGAVLTLSVSNSISGITNFSFNIVIEGIG